MANIQLEDDVLAAYVRGRLSKELRMQRGGGAEIARQTGFSGSHISNIADGHRRVGRDFALAMAKYWNLTMEQLADEAHKGAGDGELMGLVSVSTLGREEGEGEAEAAKDEAPRERVRSRPVGDMHPNLTATLSWCQTVYPPKYLAWFGQGARQWMSEKTRPEWLAEVQRRYPEWAREQRGGESEAVGTGGGAVKDTNRSGVVSAEKGKKKKKLANGEE